MQEANPDGLGPDLTLGIAVDDLADGAMLAGHVGEEAVLLARRGNAFFAIGATCSHYGGPLAQGLVVDDTVRCPWHHACFSLRTGEALRALRSARSPLVDRAGTARSSCEPKRKQRRQRQKSQAGRADSTQHRDHRRRRCGLRPPRGYGASSTRAAS